MTYCGCMLLFYFICTYTHTHTVYILYMTRYESIGLMAYMEVSIMCFYSRKRDSRELLHCTEQRREKSLWLTIMSGKKPTTQQQKHCIKMALQLSSFFTGQFDLESKLKAPFPHRPLYNYRLAFHVTSATN